MEKRVRNWERKIERETHKDRDRKLEIAREIKKYIEENIKIESDS